MAVVYDPDSIYVRAFKLFMSEEEDSLEKLKSLNYSLLQKRLPDKDDIKTEKPEPKQADEIKEIPQCAGFEVEEELPRPSSNKKPKTSSDVETIPQQEIVILDDSVAVDEIEAKTSDSGNSNSTTVNNIFATMSKKVSKSEKDGKREKVKVPKEERSSGKSESSKNTDGVPAKKLKVGPKVESSKAVDEDAKIVQCFACSESFTVAKNEIVECVSCSKHFHQKCHVPPILESEATDPRLKWSCKTCSHKQTSSSSTAKSSSKVSQISSVSSDSSQNSATSSSGLAKMKSKNKDKEHKISLAKTESATASTSSSKITTTSKLSASEGPATISKCGNAPAPTTPSATSHLGGGGLFSNLAAAWGNLHTSSSKSSPSSSKASAKTGQTKDDSLSSKQHTAGSAFLAGLARQASVPDRPVNRASPELSSSSSKTSTSSGSPSKTSSGDFATPSLKSLSSSKASSSGNVKFADDIFGKPGSSLSKTVVSTSKKISSNSTGTISSLTDSTSTHLKNSSSSSVSSSSSSLIGSSHSSNNSSSSSSSKSMSPNEAAMKRLKMMEKKASARRNNQNIF